MNARRLVGHPCDEATAMSLMHLVVPRSKRGNAIASARFVLLNWRNGLSFIVIFKEGRVTGHRRCEISRHDHGKTRKTSHDVKESKSPSISSRKDSMKPYDRECRSRATVHHEPVSRSTPPGEPSGDSEQYEEEEGDNAQGDWKSSVVRHPRDERPPPSDTRISIGRERDEVTNDEHDGRDREHRVSP